MSRQSRRVAVKLDARGLQELPEDDLKAVLRGADDLIGQGGRTLLMRILRGSANKDVLDLGLDRSPVHGHFRELSNEDTLARIDWAILNGYLRIEHAHRLPLLVYTQTGWEIEREQFSNELLVGIETALSNGPPYHMEHLKDRDREMIWQLLDKVAATGDSRFIPALEAWKKVDYKKVQQRIRQVIQQLESSNGQ
jgi:superfamily II DNA helicase RecQ